MKTQSDEFTEKEEGAQRQPAELYHIWRGTDHWRYTSGDVSVIYNEEEYFPATIQREEISYDEKLDVNTLTLQISRVTDPVLSFVAISFTDLVWISVYKIHRDMLIQESSPIFVGQIKSVTFTGTTAQVHCVGFEHYLKKIVPRYRYGPGCQHTLYDEKCGVNIDDYTDTVSVVSLDSTGLFIANSLFAEKEDTYYTFGYLTFGDYSRMITSHNGSTIGLRYPISSLAEGDTITVCAGCDRTRATCRDRFDNLVNHLGFPDIPIDNPATWA